MDNARDGQTNPLAGFVDAEVALWLEAEASDDTIDPRSITIGGRHYVLAFEDDNQIAEMSNDATNTIVLPGRALAHMLAGSAMGIAFHAAGSEEAQLIEPEQIDWFVTSLGAPSERRVNRKPVEFLAPDTLHDQFLEILAQKLNRFAQEEMLVCFARARYVDGTEGEFLAFLDAPVADQVAFRTLVREALAFAHAGVPDLESAFLPGDITLADRLKNVANVLRFSKASPQEYNTQIPGSDPAKPPKLR